MARRRWPTVLEACGQVARRQLVSEVAQKEQDVPARLVRERSKDSLGVGCRGPSHANERLAFGVTISKIQNNLLGASPTSERGRPRARRSATVHVLANPSHLERTREPRQIAPGAAPRTRPAPRRIS